MGARPVWPCLRVCRQAPSGRRAARANLFRTAQRQGREPGLLRRHALSPRCAALRHGRTRPLHLDGNGRDRHGDDGIVGRAGGGATARRADAPDCGRLGGREQRAHSGRARPRSACPEPWLPRRPAAAPHPGAGERADLCRCPPRAHAGLSSRVQRRGRRRSLHRGGETPDGQGQSRRGTLGSPRRVSSGTAVTDIFISYAREDRDVAGKVAEALTQRGFKVWWDWELIGGDNYRFKIREVIGEAKKSIVLWSRHSIMSAFVIDEASEAKKHGKLIPVSIDGSDPPFGFGDLHTIALDAPRIDVKALVAALEGKAPPREQDLRKARRGFGLPKIAAVAAACLIAAAGAYWSWSRIPATPTPEPARQAEKPATPQAFTSRIALVIGNRAYKELPVIENAVRDADLVSAELQRRGFKVIKQLDLTAEEMTRAFKDFEALLSVVGGVGVFYYAGSAVYIDGEDILLPIDATADAQ